MLYIRTDMNDKIATGHIMRCLSIANAVREYGEETIFILADEQAVEILKMQQYEYIVLHTKWDQMDSELSILKQEIKKRNIKQILIDTYQVTENYLKSLSEVVRTIYIDDLNAFYYPVDSIICYANYWEKFQYKEKYLDKILFLGTQYVPLKKEFSDCTAKKVKQEVENLLLLSGGTDPYDILDRLLQKIKKEQYKRIDVICGVYYMKYEMMREKYFVYQNVYIHSFVTNMKECMDLADLVITAGGTTLYELCAVGTPAISYSIADNQLENVKKFQEDGIIDYAGDVRTDDVIEQIDSYLNQYYGNQLLRQERSLKMQKLVDGKGSKRIAEGLKNIELKNKERKICKSI